MAQYLLEILSEEIPARMQPGAARDLARLAGEALAAAGFAEARVRTFAGPRRLTLVADDLPLAQADLVETRKGPRVGAPDAALEGFLRSTGVTRDQLEARDGVWFATLTRRGRPTAEVMAELAAGIIARFPWPKSMLSASGRTRWVRPIRRLVSLFDGVVAPFAIDGLQAGALSEGHRVMGQTGPFAVTDFSQYQAELERRFVVLEAEARKRRILEGASALAAAEGLELVQDAGLLEETAGMVEWPVPVLGAFDPAYLDVPGEVIRTTMRVNQRYFALRRPGEAGLAPHFICIANIVSPDGPDLIVAGNRRVLEARLSDARFFWDEDRKTPLEARRARLAGVTFHARLGTMLQRAERLEAAARVLARYTGADPDLAALAGRLAKADLASGMVGEFPELQGVMGGYYARHEGLPEPVAEAIAAHYRPQGPSDAAPSAPTAMAVALADKLDVLVGFFRIGEAPTGSRDPFALRRAALGVIRIALENQLRLPLGELLGALNGGEPPPGLLDFIRDRLKVALRDQGARPDQIEAVFALGDDDMARLAARLEALARFLETADGAHLLAGFKRADNILAAEARKGPLPKGAPVRAATPDEEGALFDALAASAPAVEAALDREDFAGAMTALARLRQPVDAFFDAVLVNAPEPEVREGRLRLLAAVTALMRRVAEFGLISG
ncbi:MAG: glycine--tRNA ligase subunit beta [Alphaproteobacteria bacterium]|nr:glycine--tRNA ligase subunit beta [Alphaproteobacteria bacterium]